MTKLLLKVTHMRLNEEGRTREAQDGPKMRPRGPKMAPGRHKMDARRLQEASRGAQTGQDGARRGQNGGQIASQLANMLMIKYVKSFKVYR